MSPSDSPGGAPTLDKKTRKQARTLAADLLRFLDDSPCAYHAVAALEARLEAAGFAALNERETFALEPNGKYRISRNGSALVAFVVGSEPPSRAGFRMLGAHTDSPALKLKPQPEVVTDGLIHLGVEVYGAPLLATWTDRDFGICGRAVLSSDGQRLETRLFKTERPVVSIPNVALHMNRTANEEGLKLNPQTQITPILGPVSEELPESGAVRKILAEMLAVEQDQIIDFDAYLYDAQPAGFAGWGDEFIRSGRLDDLAMCHAGVTALCDVCDLPAAATRLVVCYDSEEIGSQTPQGAQSNLLPNVLERICLARGDDREGFLAALAASLLVSADNAHAAHPGYADKSEPQHAPVLNGGPVIKVHASRAYATDAYAAAFFELACREAGVPHKRFVNRSDVRSGHTIGSMTAAQLGVPTADVGSAQYAMHSVREMAGAYDPWYMTQAMRAFLSSSLR